MTKKIKTPKPKSPYGFTPFHRNAILALAGIGIVSSLIGSIFSLVGFTLFSFWVLVILIGYIIMTILDVVIHTNRRVVDLIDRIDSVERIDRPADGTDQP